MNKLVLKCLAITLLLTGCNEFEKLSIAEENGSIVFYIDQKTLENNQTKGYIIEDFGVAKENCDSDCVMREILNKSDSELKELKGSEPFKNN